MQCGLFIIKKTLLNKLVSPKSRRYILNSLECFEIPAWLIIEGMQTVSVCLPIGGNEYNEGFAQQKIKEQAQPSYQCSHVDRLTALSQIVMCTSISGFLLVWVELNGTQNVHLGPFNIKRMAHVEQHIHCQVKTINLNSANASKSVCSPRN